MQAQLYAARTLRTARTALAVLLCGLAFAAFGQPDPGQPRTPAPTIDAATGHALNAAIAALQAGKQAEARVALARLDATKLSPYERSKVEQILFNVAYAEEDYVEARQHLQNALDAGGLNAQEISQVRYQAAQLLMSQEEWQEGAAALEDWLATAVNPNGAAYYLLAVAYYQMDDFARALPPAQRAVDLANEPHEGWIGMLLALYLKNEQYTDAVPLLQKLVAIAPAKKSYWLQLSAAYGQLEDYPNALSTLQVAYNAGWFQQAMQSERHRSMARAYLDIIEQTIATPSSKPLDREG